MIRPATEADADALWAMLEPVIRAGETYALPRDMDRAAALDHWLRRPAACFVVEVEGQVLGTYYLKPNQLGPGAHVANAGYVVGAEGRGRGLARRLCAHSLEEARRRGYRAMQFNCVVETNTAAVHLWESMGFAKMAHLPAVFDHPRLGPVGAFLMFRTL